MLVLASASQRRLELLHCLGVTSIDVQPADLDETPLKKELARSYVTRLALAKAQHGAQKKPGFYVLAADTTISMGRRLFHKAETAEEARFHMACFSGRRHRVYTGLCVITPEGQVVTRVAQTVVAFKRLSNIEIEAFAQSDNWEGVCGYRIQGIAGGFVRFVRGQPSNVMGLPLFDTAQLLQGVGFPLWRKEEV